MSYDISFFKLPGIKPPLEEVEAMLDEEFARDESGEEILPSEIEDERRKSLASDLVDLSPVLRMEPSDRGFSYGCVITTDDENCYIPEIYIGIGAAFLGFSYSADFEAVFREVNRIIAVFDKHGYTAYDPQSESILEPENSLKQSTDMAISTRNAVADKLSNQGEYVLGLGRQPKKKSLFTFSDILAVIAVIVGLYFLITAF